MYRDALDTFRGALSPDTPARHAAATVLVKRYDDIGDEACPQLQEAAWKNEHQRLDLRDTIIDNNPSLIEDDSLRLLVRVSLHSMEDPHETLVQLASYIDKNSRADTDFIIKESFRCFGVDSVSGEEHALNAPAHAIAKVFDGNVSPEYAVQITKLRQFDTERGRALASAFKELERPAEASAKRAMAVWEARQSCYATWSGARICPAKLPLSIAWAMLPNPIKSKWTQRASALMTEYRPDATAATGPPAVFSPRLRWQAYDRLWRQALSGRRRASG